MEKKRSRQQAAGSSSSSGHSAAAVADATHSASSAEPPTRRARIQSSSATEAAPSAAASSSHLQATSSNAGALAADTNGMSDEQHLLSEWNAALRGCLTAFAADPLPSRLEEATGRAHELVRSAQQAAATGFAAFGQVAQLLSQVELPQRQTRRITRSIAALFGCRDALLQARAASHIVNSWNAARSGKAHLLALMLDECVSADTTTALSRLLRLWLQVGITLGGHPFKPGAIPTALMAGLNSCLDDLLREISADVNNVLRSKLDGRALLDFLVPDPQLPKVPTFMNNLDMRPMLSLLTFGLDPTLITPQHSISPLQRARQQVRALSDEQIVELGQRLTQLTAPTPQQATGSTAQHRGAVDEFIAFKRLHPWRLDEEWTELWEERRERLSVAFAIELDCQWAAHSARMRQLLLSDSTLLSSFGGFTLDLTPIICAFVGVDIERPLPTDAAADQPTVATESDVTMVDAESSVEQKEVQ